MIEVSTSPARLNQVLGRISRALRYRTRVARAAFGVTDSESELLRLLRRQPDIRVHDAAVELGIASNSVSTLLKQLSRLGFIERSADPLDGRAARLRITPSAEAFLGTVGSARETAMARALDQLEPCDRDILDQALPTLARLSELLVTTAQ